MKWISVKEQLPENDEEIFGHYWVLVYAEHSTLEGMPVYALARRSKEGMWEFVSKYGDPHNYDGLGVFFCGDAFRIKTTDVTHWMPLPPKPD